MFDEDFIVWVNMPTDPKLTKCMCTVDLENCNGV